MHRTTGTHFLLLCHMIIIKAEANSEFHYPDILNFNLTDILRIVKSCFVNTVAISKSITLISTYF